MNRKATQARKKCERTARNLVNAIEEMYLIKDGRYLPDTTKPLEQACIFANAFLVNAEAERAAERAL